MAFPTLTTTAYTKPGVYIGKIYRNQAGPPAGFRRYPSIVAKGSRYQTLLNTPIRRSYLTGVSLTFTSVSPNIATLSYNALPNKVIAKLYMSNGTPIAFTKWSFIESVIGSGNYDQVLIQPDAYDPAISYLLDYQSTDRTIQDDLIAPDLRQILFVGDTENQSKYEERVNYFVPVTTTVPVPDAGNANSLVSDHGWTAVTAGGKTPTVNPIAVGPTLTPLLPEWNDTYFPNTGTGGVVTPTITSLALTHKYNRRYRLVVGTVTPHDMYLIAEQNSGGLTSAAPVPIQNTIANAQYPAGMIAVAVDGGPNSLSFTDPEIGEVITIDFDLTGKVPDVGNSYLVTAYGSSFMEVDATLTNTNQYGVLGAITASNVVAGAAMMSFRADADYTDTSNRGYRVQCTAAAGASHNRTASFVYCGWGEYPPVTGTFSISETTATNGNVDLGNGILAAFAFGVNPTPAANFVVGDTFSFTATAARRFISAKDSRNYTITVGSSSAGAIGGIYAADTFEGSFRSFAVTGPAGSLPLPGDIRMWFRNIGTTVAQNRYVAGDIWTFSTTDEQTMDWSLTSRVTDTIAVSKVNTDKLGLATGTVGAYFVVLGQIPTSLLYVRDSVTGAIITGSTLVSGKPFLQLAAVPANPIEVYYEYIGPEPAPGQYYYVTSLVLRPTSEYNTPIFFSSYDDGAAPFLGPAATDNDIMIGAQLALKDNFATGAYVIQVYDSDQDGVYSTYDYEIAIDKALSVTKNTDLIVLGKSETLSRQMVINEQCNNPFIDHVNLALWVGMPTGSTIGSVDEPGSFVYTCQRTLQLPVESQSRGTRVCIPNSEATKTIQLGDGSQVSVTLDGSYIALAVASLNASYADPNTLLLDQTISGFDTMQTFNEDEINQIGTASGLVIYNAGTESIPVFKVLEGITIDNTSDDLHEINVAINVRTFTQSDMREFLRTTAIGILPTSDADGVAYWRTQIVLRLNYYLSQGIIGSYQDDNGGVRELDPNTDVQVLRSKTRKTSITFLYLWWGRFGITRGFGLYAVDTNSVTQSGIQ